MMKIISTDSLGTIDIPRQYATWSKIVDFASTFDLEAEGPFN